MSLENLGSVGTNANFDEGGSSGGSSLYGNTSSGNSKDNKLNEFIDGIMSSGKVRILTFGLSSIFEASKNVIPDIASVMRPLSIGSVTSGLSLPTPGQIFSSKKAKGGASKCIA